MTSVTTTTTTKIQHLLFFWKWNSESTPHCGSKGRSARGLHTWDHMQICPSTSLFSMSIKSTAHTHAHHTHSADLNFLPLDVHGSYTEVHSDGVLLPLWENPWFEVLNHTGLPDVRVSDQDDLKQEIKRVIVLRSWGLHGGGTGFFFCGCVRVRKEEMVPSYTVDHFECLDCEAKRWWVIFMLE